MPEKRLRRTGLAVCADLSALALLAAVTLCPRAFAVGEPQGGGTAPNPSDQTILLDGVPAESFVPVPEGVPIQRHVFVPGVGEVTDMASAAGTVEVVYSNTGGTVLFPPGAGKRIADDIYSTVFCGCTLSAYSIMVGGGGDGSGPGFTVDFGLWDNCPATGGVLIPGTSDTMELPDDGLHLITVDVSAADIPIQSLFWVSTRFYSGGVGWVIGAPPEIGYSNDIYDYPFFSCAARTGNPLIYAGFYVTLSCEEDAPPTPTQGGPGDGAEDVPVETILTWSDPSGVAAGANGPPNDLDPSALFDPHWADDLPPGQWCGTQERYLSGLAQRGGGAAAAGACLTEGVCDDPVFRDQHIPDEGSPIKTYRMSLHVFCEDSGNNCVSNQAEVDAQLATLNENYASSAIQFVYDTIFHSSSQFRNFSPSEEDAMKSIYADSPAQKLNVYVVANSGGFSVGTFPWDPIALTYQGGIIMADFMFAANGTTLAHEVGHNLGLWHTHHGVSEVGLCSDCWERADGVNGDTTGDFCADTAPTPVNWNCGDPFSEDSCSDPQRPWAPTDPQNYMSYAPMFCQTEFTPQQAGRNHCWTQAELTTWLDTGGCAARYDVRLGTADPPSTLICEGILDPSCDPGTLNYATTYYWQVVAAWRDMELIGPIWSFTTQSPIASSDPPICAIDAGQPHAIDDAKTRYGWDSVDVSFRFDPSGVPAGDFEVFQVPPDGPSPPNLLSVTPAGGNVLTAQFSAPINPGKWTCLRYKPTNSDVCLGYLPCDTGGDGTCAPPDILAVIDALNGVTPRPGYSVDVDRSGQPGPPDILRVIDLLNGAGEFDTWMNRALGPCPASGS